jgi:hypothetical protein
MASQRTYCTAGDPKWSHEQDKPVLLDLAGQLVGMRIVRENPVELGSKVNETEYWIVDDAVQASFG